MKIIEKLPMFAVSGLYIYIMRDCMNHGAVPAAIYAVVAVASFALAVLGCVRK